MSDLDKMNNLNEPITNWRNKCCEGEKNGRHHGKGNIKGLRREERYIQKV